MSKGKAEKSQKGYVGAMAYQAELAREMSRVYQFEHWLRSVDEDETDISSVRIKFPEQEGGDFLLIVRASVKLHPKVAFHGAPTFKEAILGFMERCRQGSLKWKDDEYANKG